MDVAPAAKTGTGGTAVGTAGGGGGTAAGAVVVGDTKY